MYEIDICNDTHRCFSKKLSKHNSFQIIFIDRRIYVHGVLIENQSKYLAVTLLWAKG